MRTRTALCMMVLLLASLTFFASTMSLGAAQDNTCEPVIQTAFENLNASCAGLSANAACFGNSASAIFADGADGGFSQPGDQVDLSTIQSIHTQPLNTDPEEWGLALLNVHANVPLALSEQGLKYILIGDVEVENGVDAASAFTPVESLTVTPLVAANLRSAPSTDARILANAEVGTELAADGLSSDAAWLRVLNGDQVAWISRQIVAAQDGGDIDSLPVVGSNTRTLMQSIFLRMGNGDAACAGAPPSMLVIQAPGGVSASITVNGVDLRFDGTVALHISDDNVMQFIVLSGGGNAGGVSVPAGFTLNLPLSEDGRSSGGGASGLRPINDNERALLTPIAEGVSGDLLYNTLSIPTQEQIAEVLAGLNASAGAQVVSGPASGAADCSRFKPTSPLGGMPLGVTPFYWDLAQGATAYRINLFAPDGSLVTSIDTGATSTTFQVDTNSFGGGSSFFWSVDALVDGQIACSSGRVNVVRDEFAQFVSGGDGGSQPEPTACSWQGC
jgi:hypothetical protein